MTEEFHIKASNISKSYQSGNKILSILHKVNLKVKPGFSIALVGESGVGKSTLLSILAALDIPDSGTVELLGRNISQFGEDSRAKLRGGKISFVFQSFQLMDDFTALENVLVPLQIAVKNKEIDLTNNEIQQQAQYYLEQVGLKDRLTHLPSQLSGGEQQRVALARAFVIEPKILFADEPTGNLDSNTGESVINLLFRLQKEKQASLVLATHDNNLANRCDNKYLLKSGELHELS